MVEQTIAGLNRAAGTRLDPEKKQDRRTLEITVLVRRQLRPDEDSAESCDELYRRIVDACETDHGLTLVHPKRQAFKVNGRIELVYTYREVGR